MFNEWYKSKTNKDLMARYRTLLISSGENMDVETEQDDWSHGIYDQLLSDGAPYDMIAEELRMEIRHLEWVERERRFEMMRMVRERS
jgi:hypothetical protein